MKKSNLTLMALADALGVAVYTAAVAFIMQNAQYVFGDMKSIWGPIAFLMLFVLSATVVGSLVFGRPVYLYFEGKKKEAVALFLYTACFMAVITFGVLLSLAAFR